MKKTQEIIGLPVISISDGNEVGRVKSIIINADKGAIDYIVVDNGVQVISASVIPAEDILGIGEYALTIDNVGVITDISEITAAVGMLQKNIQVKETRVMTKKGRLVGETGDFYVDEDQCCVITGLEFIGDITQKKVRILPRENVITFGKTLIVVTEDIEDVLLESAAQISTAEKFAGAEKKNLVNLTPSIDDYNVVTEVPVAAEVDPAALEADRIIAADGQNYYKEVEMTQISEMETEEAYVPEEVIFDEVAEEPAEEPAEETGSVTYEEELPVQAENIAEAAQQAPVAEPAGAASLFEQKQRQYLKGRRATKTITDNYGNVIISEGTVINDELIDVAKQHGKLIELVMNNKA